MSWGRGDYFGHRCLVGLWSVTRSITQRKGKYTGNNEQAYNCDQERLSFRGATLLRNGSLCREVLRRQGSLYEFCRIGTGYLLSLLFRMKRKRSDRRR